MRTRYLKPGFFENEDLAALPATTRLLFAGLWLVADKEGRLRDRPPRIKGELFPYDNTNVERGLKQLADAGFIVRYEADGQRLICIPSWSRHQRPHPHEPESTLPEHEHDQCSGDVIALSGSRPPLTRTGTGTRTGTIKEDEDEDAEPDAASAAPPAPDLKENDPWGEIKGTFEDLFGMAGGVIVKEAQQYARIVPREWFATAIQITRDEAERPAWKYTKAILDRCIADQRPPGSRAAPGMKVPEGSARSQFMARAGRS